MRTEVLGPNATHHSQRAANVTNVANDAVGIATDTIMLLAHNKQLLLVYA